MSDLSLIDNLIKSELPAGWLTVWDISAILQLGHLACLRWIQKQIPPEYISKRGNHRIVHIDGLRAGLEKCVWRPNSPAGYQGQPGLLPVNVNCRDERGRFVSHRPPGTPRPLRAKGMDTSRRRKYIASDAPSTKSGGSKVQDE